MTFREFMKENGYELQTTFWNDFTIADHFGLAGIQDTFNRAFEEWKDNCKYLTELTLVLNHKVWQHHETKPQFSELYEKLCMGHRTKRILRVGRKRHQTY